MNELTISREELFNQASFFNRKRKATKQAHGFNSSPDKSRANNNTYIMTDYVAGHHYEKVDGKRKKVLDYKPLFESLDEAFDFAKQQRQVFTGLNHFRRDVVVIDIDQSYEPCFTEEQYKERVSTLCSLSTSYNLPCPSYVEFHTDSGHCQAGWYLTEYFTKYNKDMNQNALYKYLYKSLAKIFFTDENFRGGNIKNPYHHLNRAFFLDKTPVDTENFIEQLKKINTGVDFPELSSNKKSSRKRKMHTNQVVDAKSVDYSRNCYAFTKTRTWMFRNIRDNNGKFPALKDVVAKFTFYEKESLPIVGKSYIESPAQIQASAIGVYNFCKSQYDPKKAAEIVGSSFSREVQEVRRYFSVLKRQATKAYKSLVAKQLRKEGRTQTEIAHLFECTQANVSILLKSDSEEDLKAIKAYLGMHIKDHSEKHQNFMKDLKAALDYVKISIYDLLEDVVPEAVLIKRAKENLLTENSSNSLAVFNSSPPPRGDPVILYLTWDTILHSETSTFPQKSTV